MDLFINVAALVAVVITVIMLRHMWTKVHELEDRMWGGETLELLLDFDEIIEPKMPGMFDVIVALDNGNFKEITNVIEIKDAIDELRFRRKGDGEDEYSVVIRNRNIISYEKVATNDASSRKQ